MTSRELVRAAQATKIMKTLQLICIAATSLSIALGEGKPQAPANPSVKIFLLGGQSNMAGFGKVADLTPPYSEPFSKVKIWSNTWQPLSYKIVTKQKYFGPEISFGHSIATSFPADDIRLIKYGVSGTALYNDWSPELKGPQYLGFTKSVDSALANLEQAGISYEIAGMMWLQGESDAVENKAESYEKNLAAFIAHVRTRYKTPRMPFVIARVRNYYGGASGQAEIVRKAQVKMAETTEHVGWFDTDDCSLINPGHYDAAGMIDIGKRFASKYTEIVSKEASSRLRSGNKLAICAAEQSVEEVVRLTSQGERGNANTVLNGYKTRTGKAYDVCNDPFTLGMQSMLLAPRDMRESKFVPALKALLTDANCPTNQRLNAHHALALLAPEYRAAHLLPNTPDLLSDLPTSPQHWKQVLDPTYGSIEAFYFAANAKPDAKYAPDIAKAIKNNEAGSTIYLGMLMKNLCGAAGVPEVLKLLKEEDWYPRWAATAALEVMGEPAKTALPELEKVLADDKEDVEVRVGAAKAIARIKDIDPFTLYKQIPDVENAVLRSTREKSQAWKKAYIQREGEALSVSPRGGTASDMSRTIYALMINRHTKEANQLIRDTCRTVFNKETPRRLAGTHMGMTMLRLLVMFGSDNKEYPGRLEKETEALLKEFVFKYCNVEIPVTGCQPKFIRDTKQVNEIYSWCKANGTSEGLNANTHVPAEVINYIGVFILMTDPLYKDRTFKTGDTPQQRYAALNARLKRTYREWALYGLTPELGSSGYEIAFWDGHLMLADLAPDPELRKLAGMYLDVALTEQEQVSINTNRGGPKSRAKCCPLGSRFRPLISLLFGERGGNPYYPNAACIRYTPPDAAILIRKLGPPQGTFEINNRFPGQLVRERDDHSRLLSRSRIYAFRTPEYVTGCTLADLNDNINLAFQNIWMGVTFWNAEAISLDGYCGSKLCVQDKDATLFQCYSGGYSFGRTPIAFTRGLTLVERDGWVFVDNAKAYVGIKVLCGGYVWDPAVSPYRVMLPNDIFSPVVMQTGQASAYASFGAFQDAVLKAPLKIEFVPDERCYDGHRVDSVTYTGPGSKTLKLFGDFDLFQCVSHYKPTKPFVRPMVAGKAVIVDSDINYESPYLQGRADSESVSLRYNNRSWNYDFKNRTIHAKK